MFTNRRYSVPMIYRTLLIAIVLIIASCNQALCEKQFEYANLPDYLQTLNLAKRFCGRNTGIDFAKHDEYKAYEIARTKGAAIKDELQYLLRVATPAGKLYAAILLRKIDREAGDKALVELQSNDERVHYGLWGCKFSIVPTKDVATSLLKRGDSIMRFFDPPADKKEASKE